MRLIASRTECGGWTLRRLEPADVGIVQDLATMDHNRCLFPGLLAGPHVLHSFLEGLETQLWSAPMVCSRVGRAEGVILNTETDISSLNARIVALFRNPREGSVALGLYVRHLLWSFPLHRVFAQYPVVATGYDELFLRAGFQDEGRLVEHAEHAGNRYDVQVVGLLREDFDAWAKATDPSLRLVHSE